MDKAFDDLLADINQQIAELQNKIQDDIDKMLQDVDNVILSDLQVDELMRQININIATIDSY
jgi:polyhydroxyalkanoate synthesis regulator phasin